MRIPVAPFAAALTLLVLASPPLAGQKSTRKPVKPQPSRGIKGTVQLPGDNGIMGVTYTMGKGDAALNFTLLSAEYSVARAAFKDPVFPKADEKLLVLHYTVQNPNPRDASLVWHSFKFTAVDSENANRVSGQGSAVFNPETGEEYGVSLKPAQKVEVVGVITVSAKNSVPKLMVERGDPPVLRYFFDGTPQHAKNVIKRLPPPFADPADSTGCVARTEVPAEKETYYPLEGFDLKLVGGSYVQTGIGEIELGDKEQLFAATITFKNPLRTAQGQTWHTFDGELKTDDGEKSKRAGLYKLKRDEELNGQQEPGEEYSARLLFKIPKDAKASKLTIWEGDGRKYVFDVSAMQ